MSKKPVSSAQQEQKDLAMMISLWLCLVGPWLPIKKRKPDGSMPDCAYLWAGDIEGWIANPDKPVVVRMGLLHDLPTTKEELDKRPKKEYPSFHALLADGWVVD